MGLYLYLVKLKIFLNSFTTLCLVLNAFSQQKVFEFKNFTQENGLPGNECYFVYRDSRNYLWIATEDGVVRYNGSKMEYFELPDNVIFKIREDHKGRIWFFSHTGKLSYFYDETIHSYKFNDSIVKYCRNILINDAYVNDSDEIILNSTRFENYRISGAGLVKRSDFYSPVPCVPHIKIDSIGHNLFFAQKLSYYKPYPGNKFIEFERSINKKKIIYRVPDFSVDFTHYGCVSTDGNTIFVFYGKTLVKLYSDGTFKTKNFKASILSFDTAANNNIWIGFTNNGALLLNNEMEELFTEPALTEKTITSIRHDYEGGTWFSTLEKGVFYLKNSAISHLTGNKLIKGPVFRLYNVGDSSILFGNYNGIFKLYNKRISPIMQLECKSVNDLFIGKDNNIYFTAGFSYANCSFLKYSISKDAGFKNVFAFCAVSEIIHPQPHKIWASTYDNVYEYDGSNSADGSHKISCSEVKVIDQSVSKPGILFLDQNGQSWLGTINALYKFSTIYPKPVRYQPNSDIFSKGITAIRQMENSIYCFGIRFGGIALMQDSTIVGNITEKEGLLSNSVKYILALKNDLWVSTAKGISVIQFRSFDPIRYTITNIGKNEGLYDLIIYQLMAYHGNILAATNNGIYEIQNPANFLSNSPMSIPLYINSVSYYKGDTTQVNSITLPYNNDRLVIKFSAICFNSPEEVKYYYRLGLKDTTWHGISSNELLLEKLIPGTYKLEIKAAIPSLHRYSEIKSMKIIVESPWWQNAWVLLGAILLLIGAFLLIYKRRVRIIQQREERNTALNVKMVELEQAALRSQMNPHFIFNCLTSIQQLIAAGNKTEANEYLVKFARLIRKTMELSINTYISIEEELGYIKEYMELEQLRIPNQFVFAIEVDNNIDKKETLIQSMMLQPIIENSIRHGIKHLKNRIGVISISLKRKDKFIDCIVKDNGVGRPKLPELKKNTYIDHKSYGLEIVKKRLEASQVEKQMEMIIIEDLSDKMGNADGTMLTLHLPYKIVNNS